MARFRDPFTTLDDETIDAARRASQVLVVRVAGAGLALVVSVLIARRFGAAETGLYFLSYSTILVFAVIGRVGLDKAIVRFVAQHAAQDDWGTVRALYRQSVGLAGAASAVLAGALVLATPTMADRLFSEPELTPVLRIMAIAVIPVALVTVHAELLKGLRRPVVGLMLSPTSIHVLVIFGILFSPVDEGVQVVAVAFLVANSIGVVVGYVLVRSSTPETRSAAGQFSFRLLVSTSLPFLVTASLLIVMRSSDTIMLGILGSPEDVGVFGASSRAAGLVALVLLAFNAVVPPRFAVFHAAGDLTALGRLARHTSALVALVALPLAVVLLVLHEQVLAIFGSEFDRGAKVLTILVIAHYLVAVTGTVTITLAMTGHQRLMQRTGFVGAVSNVALNALLIPAFGITGAALATGSSLVLVNALNGMHVYRRLGLVLLPVPTSWVARVTTSG